MTVRKCAFFREGLQCCKPPEVFQFYKVTKLYKKEGERGGKRKKFIGRKERAFIGTLR